MLENRVLRKRFGPKTDEGTEKKEDNRIRNFTIPTPDQILFW